MSIDDLLRDFNKLRNDFKALQTRDNLYYSTGTYTPTFSSSGGAGVFTYTLQAGRYTRIGRIVHFEVDVVIDTFTSVPAGNLQVSLPFAQVGSEPQGAIAVGYRSAGLSTVIHGYIGISATTILFLTTGAAVVAASVLSAGSQIILSGVYTVA